MATGKPGVGIVGCGTIADIHAQALAKLPACELIGCYSRSGENARRLGEKYGIAHTSRWTDFISDENLNVVSICTPSGTHLEYGTAAAEAGKHVIVEKPVEVTAARGKQLISTCRGRNVKLAVIFQNRYLKDVQKLKLLLEAGKLGKIFLADAYVKWFRSQEYYDSAAWRGTLDLDGGGVLINQAIHTIDLLQWLAGDVTSVFARTGIFAHHGVEGEDTAVATLSFVRGAVGVLVASTAVNPPMERRLEIHGEKGTAILKGDRLVFFGNRADDVAADDVNQNGGSGASGPLAGFSIEPHLKQFEQIFRAIRSGNDPPVTGEEALKSLAIVKAVYASAETNLPASIDKILSQDITES